MSKFMMMPRFLPGTLVGFRYYPNELKLLTSQHSGDLGIVIANSPQDYIDIFWSNPTLNCERYSFLGLTTQTRGSEQRGFFEIVAT